MEEHLSGYPLTQEELTEIIRNIPDSIAIYDRNGELVLCSNLVNESAERKSRMIEQGLACV